MKIEIRGGEAVRRIAGIGHRGQRRAHTGEIVRRGVPCRERGRARLDRARLDDLRARAEAAADAVAPDR